MKYFDITKKYRVKVNDEDSEADAIKLIDTEPQKYLHSETVTRTEYKQKPQQKSGNGWGTAFKDQLLGSNGNR